MAYETAVDFRTKKGARFGDLTNDQLSELSGWIGKALAKNGNDPEHTTDLQAQQSAIAAILAGRNGDGRAG